MIWNFPNLDTLRLALTGGAVPPSISLAPVWAGFTDDGQVSIETEAAVPKAVQNELKKLGVPVARTAIAEELEEYYCWPQVFALVRAPDVLAKAGQTPVLFNLPANQMPTLVTEILRLGNDRQTFRYLEEDEDGESRALLRVIGPPYYSLLRAIDRNGDPNAPVAYTESTPRAWVEFGHAHPLGNLIKVPAGKWLLMRPPREWVYLDEAPLRDIYEVMEFALPSAKSPFHDTEPSGRLKVTMKLAPGGPLDISELWVIRNRPVEQLDTLVSGADDQLLQQLAFAVAEKDGQKLIILRARPSKRALPILTLDAVGFRSYLKLQNLFLPMGMSLHPPLRRDAVRKLLADDPAIITWLYPEADGKFTPETLPDTAFRPLADWIDYVLDNDRAALQTWVQAAQFDFEPFVCSEDDKGKPKKPPGEGKERGPGRKDKGKEKDEEETATRTKFTKATKKEEVAEVEEEEPEAEPEKIEPSVAEKQLKELEARFLALEGAIDSDERRAMWPELARLNAAARHPDDAGLCWLHWFWAEEPSATHAWEWFRVEASNVELRKEAKSQKGHSWASAATQAAAANREISGDDLDRLLELDDPGISDVRSLAAYLFWAARRKPASSPLVQRLGKVRHFLESHERLLPIRAVWLAWSSLAKLGGGDVLNLARARDRLLERLLQGLRPEQELPSFLRFGGEPSSDRYRAFRTWMVGLHTKAENWLRRLRQDHTMDQKARTSAYLDLIFAFGLMRLGEVENAQVLLEHAKAALADGDEVHQFLVEAYIWRIEQVRDGKPHTGPLPSEFMETLQAMASMSRYYVDRLRDNSRILEPVQKNDPYRHGQAKPTDLEKRAAEVQDVIDRKELTARIEELLKDVARDNLSLTLRSKVYRIILDLVPRASEELSLQTLRQLGAFLEKAPVGLDPNELAEHAEMLESALFVAAHFGRADHVQVLVTRFQKMLHTQTDPKNLEHLASLVGHCCRGLRKLGMREEIEKLTRQVANRIFEVHGVKKVQELVTPLAKAAEHSGSVRGLLHLAGAWFYSDRLRDAEPILNAARELLLSNTLEPLKQTPLACTYATTLGQAPVELAQRRIDELFEKVQRVTDSYTTIKYYGRHQLEFVEAVVLAVVSDDFTMGSNVRRWLDDDEFLVRRRIHRDLNQLMAQTES